MRTRVRWVVKKGGNRWTDGASQMRTEDLKIWLAGVENKEKA
jgi:hypothetical protein